MALYRLTDNHKSFESIGLSIQENTFNIDKMFKMAANSDIRWERF